MGTMIQGYAPDEAAYRGQRFHDWPSDLKGNNDLLTLTQPAMIREIHQKYLGRRRYHRDQHLQFQCAGAGRLPHGGSGRGTQSHAARLAREAADESAERTGQPRFVAGAIGPTNRTASLSPHVNDPGFRNISFDQLVATYSEASAALIEGGVDLILIETIFDTLNAKAALFAVRRTMRELSWICRS
jgi:5-methyltetrahydrofolate--homocysteine methyltransferase